jgi:DNA gyrase subunit A
MVVTVSHEGYIKRTPLSTYRAQKRGGKGNKGMEARDDDWVTQLFSCSTHSYVFFFSNLGKLYVKKVYQIPEGARNAKGRAIINFIGLEQDEKVQAITPVEGFREGLYLTTVTRRGQIKKTEITEYQNFREKGIIGVKLADGDQLLSAVVTDGSQEFLLATKSAKSIRFPESQVRPMGRSAGGVRGIDLEGEDVVVGFCCTNQTQNQVLAICERGYGKRTHIDEYRQQNRGGKGMILIDASDRNGPVVGIALVSAESEVMLMTDRGQTIRTRVGEIRETGRNAQGVRIMNVEDGERVVAMEPVGETEDDDALKPGTSEPGSDASVPADSSETAPDQDAPENEASAADEGTDDADEEAPEGEPSDEE